MIPQHNFYYLLLITLLTACAPGNHHESPKLVDHFTKIQSEKNDVVAVSKPMPLELEFGQPLPNGIEQKVSSNQGYNELEPFIAVNPTNSNNLVLSYMLRSPHGLQFPVFYTYDGGDSWQASPFNAQEIWFEDTSLSIIGGGDPMMAFDADGKLYFSWIYAGSNSKNRSRVVTAMYWAYSLDGGASWEIEDGEARFIGKGGYSDGKIMDYGRGFFDKQWMACDKSSGPNRNTLYSSFLFYANNHKRDPVSAGMLSSKPPQQRSFSPVLTPISEGVPFGTFNNIHVDNKGVIHASYLGINKDFTSKGVFYRKSYDGGANFEKPIKVGDGFGIRQNSEEIHHDRENPAPSLAIAPNGQHVYLAWSSEVIEHGKWVTKGYLAKSATGGNRWSKPIDLTTLDDHSGFRHSLMPVIACDDFGNLSMAWYSIDSMELGHYILVESRDQGQNFSKAVRLTSVPTDFSRETASFGDYFNLVRTQNKTYAVWADGRFPENSRPKVYAGVYEHDPVFSGITEFQPLNSPVKIASISPQPATDRLTIALNLTREINAELSLYTLDGKVVFIDNKQLIEPGDQQIDFTIPNSTPAGMYVLYIKSEAGLMSKKVMVQ